MNNGLKIGLLAVIAVILGVIAFKMYSNDDMSGPVSRPDTDTQVSATKSNGQSTTTPSTSSPQKFDPSTANGKKAIQSEPDIAPTKMEFNEYEWDFGTIDEGDRVEHIFKFTNTGSEPLVLSKCKGSCGCTVPTCPKDPVLPGEEGEIKVAFNSKGKPNKQAKKVTITANTEPAETFINIRAFVNPAPKDDAQ